MFINSLKSISVIELGGPRTDTWAPQGNATQCAHTQLTYTPTATTFSTSLTEGSSSSPPRLSMPQLQALSQGCNSWVAVVASVYCTLCWGTYRAEQCLLTAQQRKRKSRGSTCARVWERERAKRADGHERTFATEGGKINRDGSRGENGVTRHNEPSELQAENGCFQYIIQLRELRGWNISRTSINLKPLICDQMYCILAKHIT